MGNHKKRALKKRIWREKGEYLDGARLKKWAYKWLKEPKDNTGGYLLQQYSRYKGDGSWFSTVHRRFRIMSPSYPTVGQVNYISDYMLSAERAIYSEDGKDPQSGKHYSKYLDIASWQDEDGNTVSADTVIDRERIFNPVYAH